MRKILKVTKSFDKGRPNISVLYSTYKYFTIYKYKYYTYKYKSSTYKYKYSTYKYNYYTYQYKYSTDKYKYSTYQYGQRKSKNGNADSRKVTLVGEKHVWIMTQN